MSRRIRRAHEEAFMRCALTGCRGLPRIGGDDRVAAEDAMLSNQQIDEYNTVGAIVVPDILTSEEVAALRRVTDEFVERARGVTAHTEIYDLEDSHSPDNPRVRRIKAAHLHHAEYARLMRHPKILAVLQDLWGPDIRFDTAKLNMKSAGFGAPVEWH